MLHYFQPRLKPALVLGLIGMLVAVTNLGVQALAGAPLLRPAAPVAYAPPEYVLPAEPPLNPAIFCALDFPHNGLLFSTSGCARCCGETALQQDSGVAVANITVGVYLHSGAAVVKTAGLSTVGRGAASYRFATQWRSDWFFTGTAGNNWIHNSEQLLFVQGNDVQRLDPRGQLATYSFAEGRATTLERSGQAMAAAGPTGYYTTLIRRPDGSYREMDAAGNQTSYSVPVNGVARVTARRDRQGNTLTYGYDANGRLATVTDPLGRETVYSYDTETGLLQYVQDFSGRQMRFEYDDAGNVIAVRSPAVTGTPTGNDFPLGKTTRFAYDSQGRLVRVWAPNQVASGGPPVVEIQYDGSGRVAALAIGGTNASGVPAGGTIHYSYGAGETTVTDRNGNQTTYTFDGAGHITAIREKTRGLRTGEPTFYETQYEYNADGQVTRVVYPEGNSVAYTYDQSNPDRLAQGNRLASTRRPDAERGGDQSQITSSQTYEPIYQQVKSATEARGNDPAYEPQNGGTWSAARYTTVYTYDYEEGCDFAAIAAHSGRTTADVEQLLDAAGLCQSPLGDINGDGHTDQMLGNVIRSQQPTMTLATDPTAGAPVAPQEIVALFTYNDFGQRLTVVDPEKNVNTYAYYSERDPNGDGVTDNPAGDANSGGYLRQITRDTASDPARNSGTNLPPVHIRHLYEYNVRGQVTREVNGRGIATDYTINQLDQVVQITRAAAHDRLTPDPAEPLPLTDFQYVTRIFYDTNDNVVLRQVQDAGNTSGVDGSLPAADLPSAITDPDPLGGPAFVDTIYQYDILNQPLATVEEVSNDGDPPNFLRTRTRYDANGNQVLTILPAGNATRAVYDERDLLFQQTRGALAPPAAALLAPADPTNYDVRGGVPATVTRHYDGNRNLVEQVDAADTDGSLANNSNIGGDGERTRTLYDGFDRATSTVDSAGNQTVVQYDPAGNVVRQLSFGPVGGATPSEDGPDTLARPVSVNGTVQLGNLVNTNLLAASEHAYDEVGREFQTDRLLFVNTGPIQRVPDVADGAADIGKGDLTPADTAPIPGVDGVVLLGRISMRTLYDRNSRRTRLIEDDGDVHKTFYDGVGRTIKTVDAEGNAVETAYDDNANVIETRETDVAQASGVADEHFLTTFFYDSLDRLVQQTDNLGQTTYYRYDSRDNLVAVADGRGPLSGGTIDRRAFEEDAQTVNAINEPGNVRLFTYDGVSRRTQEEMVLTASGEGDGNMGVDANGVKLGALTPDFGQGGGDGRISIHYAYDDNSLLASLIDDNGNQTQYTYDDLDRRLTETKGVCVQPELADRCDPPTTLTYTYDPDGNVVSVTNENGSVTTTTYDALNRPIAENMARGPGVVGTTAMTYEYDGLSRLTQATDDNDPGDGGDDATLTYAYDSLGRILEESQQMGSGPAYPVSSSWRAQNLRSGLTYPNGRDLAFIYDNLDRLQTIGETAAAAHFLYLPILGADGAQARRTGFSNPQAGAAGTAQTLVTYTYIGRSRILARRYANGTRLTYLDDTGAADTGYDGLRRPVSLRHLGADNSLIVGFSHIYDRANNKQIEEKLHDPANSELYAYDSADRLLEFQRGQLNPGRDAIVTPTADQLQRQQWQLDGVGNWSQNITTAGGTTETENRDHTSFNELYHREDGVSEDFVYDDNGNLVEDATHTYAWDARNRLRRVVRKSDGALIAAYSYDALGRRMRKVVQNSGDLDGSTRFLYDGWRVLAERDGSGALTQQYVYGGSYIDEVLVLDRNQDGDDTATGDGDQRLWYHQNSLYSVYALTDQQGEVVEGYLYDAYGRATVYGPGTNGQVDFGGDDGLADRSGAGNPYLFTGRRLVPETGWYFYRARHYDPLAGRFTARDPSGFNDGLNLYQYAGGLPTTALDFLGLARVQASIQFEMQRKQTVTETSSWFLSEPSTSTSTWQRPFPSTAYKLVGTYDDQGFRAINGINNSDRSANSYWAGFLDKRYLAVAVDEGRIYVRKKGNGCEEAILLLQFRFQETDAEPSITPSTTLGPVSVASGQKVGGDKDLLFSRDIEVELSINTNGENSVKIVNDEYSFPNKAFRPVGRELSDMEAGYAKADMGRGLDKLIYISGGRSFRREIVGGYTSSSGSGTFD